MENILEECAECIREEIRLGREYKNAKKRVAELTEKYDDFKRKCARMASETKLTGLEALPAELLCTIARELDFYEVEHLRRCSRALYEKIDHDAVWKPVYGEVPEQILPINKYQAADAVRECRNGKRIGKYQLLGFNDYNKKFYYILDKIRVNVPEYLHNRLYFVDFENIGGILFLYVENPRTVNFYKDLEKLLRIGVIAVPNESFNFHSEKIIFVKKPTIYDKNSIKGFLFTVATSDFRPFDIYSQEMTRNACYEVRDIGETIEFKQRSRFNNSGSSQTNYFSLDVSEKSDGVCKLIKTEP